MTKTKLTVATPFGTFTRTTARAYAYLVIGIDVRSEWLEAKRQNEMKFTRENVQEYVKTIATGQCQHPRKGVSGDFDRECTAKFLADGSYAKWVKEGTERLQALDAQGVISADQPQTTVIGWTSRFDLAAKLTSGRDADRFRTVHIIDVATGKVVR